MKLCEENLSREHEAVFLIEKEEVLLMTLSGYRPITSYGRIREELETVWKDSHCLKRCYNGIFIKELSKTTKASSR
jgi:hypothetical protein